MKKKRTRAGGEWTEARYWSFVRSVLRQGSRRYPPIVRHALEAVREPVRAKHKIGRRKWEYRCDECGELFFRDQVQVDHIKPVGKLLDYDDLPEFVATLLCERDNLRVLCAQCHKERA